MDIIDLNGTWQLTFDPLDSTGLEGLKRLDDSSRHWLSATIPGEVHLDLMKAGMMNEPMVGSNAPECRWPEKKSWWYRREFVLTAQSLDYERQFLVFDGIDYYGQIFLNGKFIGETGNSFIPHRFEVNNYLVLGYNILTVRVTAGNELAKDDGAISRPLNIDDNAPHPIKDDPAYRDRNWLGRIWLRKFQFSYGWDWVDALPNIGIWRDVRLEMFNYAKFEDIAFRQEFVENKVILFAETCVENLHPWEERQAQIILDIRYPDQKLIHRAIDVSLLPGLNYCDIPVEIISPELWWPNGMGRQPLYQVSVTLDKNKVVLDQRDYELGLRKITIDRSRLYEGSRFCLKVNGQEVFCRGANWVPADAVPARIPQEKYQALIDAAVDANFNMLRVWGGGIYESPAFYQACDRAGIMVWQDFMFACAIYPDFEPEFCKAVEQEAEVVVKMLRHHPAIVLWCGNNENHWGLREWWNEPDKKPLNCGGKTIYNRILPEVCRKLDPGRPYWPGSPSGGIKPNCETDGDCHWWEPFTMNKRPENRVLDQVFDACRSRFVSEYGVIGPCSPVSIKKFLRPEEIEFNHPAWRRHTNPYTGNTIQFGLEYHYGIEAGTLSIDEYLRYGQLLQATLLERSLEALRFRKHDATDDCQGALIWMFNDCWGETGWSIIDYYLERKAAFYAVKRAFKPLKAIIRQRGDQLVSRVVNDTLETQYLDIETGWMKLDGSDRIMRTDFCELPPNSMRQIAATDIPSHIRTAFAEWIFCAILKDANNILDTAYFKFCPFKSLRLARPYIEVKSVKNCLVLTSAEFCHGVHHDHPRQKALSDNWFDMLPGVPLSVDVDDDVSAGKISFDAVTPAKLCPIPDGII